MKKETPIKKVILLIVLIVFAIFFSLNSAYDSIEEKILDDINIGSTIDDEMVVDLFIVDEYSEEFYVCVGETSAKRICVLSIQYNPSGFMHGKKQGIFKDKLLNVPTRMLTVNKKKIVYGFTDKIDIPSIEINGTTVEVLIFSYPDNTKEKTIGFWYYVEE